MRHVYTARAAVSKKVAEREMRADRQAELAAEAAATVGRSVAAGAAALHLLGRRDSCEDGDGDAGCSAGGSGGAPASFPAVQSWFGAWLVRVCTCRHRWQQSARFWRWNGRVEAHARTHVHTAPVIHTRVCRLPKVSLCPCTVPPSPPPSVFPTCLTCAPPRFSPFSQPPPHPLVSAASLGGAALASAASAAARPEGPGGRPKQDPVWGGGGGSGKPTGSLRPRSGSVFVGDAAPGLSAGPGSGPGPGALAEALGMDRPAGAAGACFGSSAHATEVCVGGSWC
jgi:hypothetical protein